MNDLKNALMTDTVTIKTQQKILKEKIDLAVIQNVIVQNLRRTKARSRFIFETNLKINIYKFIPNDHLELVVEGQKSGYAQQYEEYKQ